MGSTSWRVAGSLLRLIDQVNAAWPARSKASDGTIGDAAHQSRDSDHNPRLVSALGGTPVVLAADITHDPAHGCDSYAVAEQIRLSRDIRVSYVISNSRVTGPNHGWRWDPYTGPDPHTGHMHVSVVAAPVADDLADWRIMEEGDMEQSDPLENDTGLKNRTVGNQMADLQNFRNWWYAAPGATTVNPPPPGSRAALLEHMLTTPPGGGMSVEDRQLLGEVHDAVTQLHTVLARVGDVLNP